ncbi:hypothetical protein [Breoghania sp. JC706]|uniref:hypothetical protein n=1 Tax=Breoghania sp. JC706 TaxID=3117732 RepID=UPI0030091FAE
MQSNGRKWLMPATIAVVAAVGLALVGMDMMLSAPPVDRVAIETLPENTPVLVAKIVGHGLDTVCVLPPEEKRVPADAVDAAAINDFLTTRTYGGDETHWALVTRDGDRFTLTRFERTGGLDLAWGADAGEIETGGLRLVPCAPGANAALVKLGETRARIVFGALK